MGDELKKMESIQNLDENSHQININTNESVIRFN